MVRLGFGFVYFNWEFLIGNFLIGNLTLIFSVYCVITSVIHFNWIVIVLLCLSCLHICLSIISLSEFCNTKSDFVLSIYLGLVMVLLDLFSVYGVSVLAKVVLILVLMECCVL